MTQLYDISEAQRWMLAAARKYDNRNAPSSITFESDMLPPWLELPTFWSGFILSGDWR
jgi:hypothetical protein